ncbi:hypothetical protein EVG20_g7663 [Dentipellis fragilis]|uniref:Uncharacterized protein n=1 Tax=Dentipellis fragilis TaxID=205917 RepID=A0A4Y9YDH1_9AGAM|nr:hypothetical protein EVG20_g7663 [Dentipellis fragilis]
MVSLGIVWFAVARGEMDGSARWYVQTTEGTVEGGRCDWFGRRDGHAAGAEEAAEALPPGSSGRYPHTLPVVPRLMS